MVSNHKLIQIHDREIEQHRRSMFYLLALASAIIVAVAAVAIAIRAISIAIR